MNTRTFEHRIVDKHGRISFKGQLYQVPANLKCGRVPMVAATEAGIMLQTGPDSFVELSAVAGLEAVSTGMNAFEGFAEKVAVQSDRIKPLTEGHVQYLARWLFYTKKADSMEAALDDAREQVAAANQRSAAKMAEAKHLETSCQLQGCSPVGCQSAARQRTLIILFAG